MCFASFVLGFLVCQSGKNLPLADSPEDDWGNLFGFALAAVGDVDGDGIQDFVVGDPNPDPYGVPGTSPGRAWLVSTRGGKKILELCGGEGGDEFGQVVAGPGDLDGDGTPDVLVGSTPTRGVRSVIRAYSGKSGALLHAVEFDAILRRDFGGWSRLCGLGDLDEDGCADYAVASVLEPEQDGPRGEIRVVSGRNGRISKLCLETPCGGEPFRSIASAGDVDHDGFQDIVATREDGANTIVVWSIRKGAPIHSISLVEGASRFPVAGGHDLDGDGTPDIVVGMVLPDASSSRLLAFSGVDALPIRSWQSRRALMFGEFVDLVGDVDRDGIPDLLVRAPDSSSQVSWVWILSGADDRVIHEWQDGPWMGSFFGVSGAAIGDVNADGVIDFLIGEASWKAGASFPGFVHLYSGKTGGRISRWRQADARFRGR